MLQSLLAPLRADLGEGDTLTLGALLAPLTAAAPAAAAAGPAQWAQHFAHTLTGCGWPGTGLGSDEQQVRARFEELLGEFAAVSVAPRFLQPAQALQLLRQLSARTAFEPASDDVPVTVTASLDDPIVHYDAIWVAGMTAEAWPQAARPDPLIPWSLQQTAAMPTASAAGMLQVAEQALRHWRRAGTRLALSWARSERDMPHDPSPLLAEAAATALHLPVHFRQCRRSSCNPGSRKLRRSWSNGAMIQARRGRRNSVLRGGTRLLELQSLCPFRSFAMLRLRAPPLPEPAPGIDARARGHILHYALELFWRATGSLSQLRERSPAASLALVLATASSAPWRRPHGALLLCLEPVVLRREGERAMQLLLLLIEWELRREPFEIAELEWQRPYAIAGATLHVAARSGRPAGRLDGCWLSTTRAGSPARSIRSPSGQHPAAAARVRHGGGRADRRGAIAVPGPRGAEAARDRR